MERTLAVADVKLFRGHETFKTTDNKVIELGQRFMMKRMSKLSYMGIIRIKRKLLFNILSDFKVG